MAEIAAKPVTGSVSSKEKEKFFQYAITIAVSEKSKEKYDKKPESKNPARAILKAGITAAIEHSNPAEKIKILLFKETISRSSFIRLMIFPKRSARGSGGLK